jgi:puromycin-sensitive aminopeptidase
MSTYLLAFIVGEFDKIEARTTTDTLVRVFTAPGKAEEGRFALDVAVKTLPYYARYFGVGYPLPKLDMVAIPDFSAGAMENWGLVTYRETAIYVNPATTSAAAQQYVALVVAHELSHQWFGNLATMQWWTDLWLNEGFATWVEYLAVDHIFPEWQIWHQFISSDFTRALKLDGLESSHPVEVEIADSADVDSIFDVISYSKGSCVVRMLVDYLGEQSFRAGMAEYLRAYQYKNATTADLWRSLAQSTGKPVAEVMSSWTLQTGYPLVTVSAAFNADTRTLTVTAEQCRFLTSGAPGGDTVWALPLKVMVAGGSGPAEASTHLVRERKASVSQQLAAETGVPTWIKVNANQAGLYRVAYPPEMLEALRKAIAAADPRLGAVDRLGLQDDAFALARVGTLPVGALLDLVQAFGAETSSAVLSDLAANLAGLSTVLLNSNIYPNYARFASRVFAPVLARVGWDKRAGETQIVSLLRSTAVGNVRRRRPCAPSLAPSACPLSLCACLTAPFASRPARPLRPRRDARGGAAPLRPLRRRRQGRQGGGRGAGPRPAQRRLRGRRRRARRRGLRGRAARVRGRGDERGEDALSARAGRRDRGGTHRPHAALCDAEGAQPGRVHPHRLRHVQPPRQRARLEVHPRQLRHHSPALRRLLPDRAHPQQPLQLLRPRARRGDRAVLRRQ